MNYVNFYGIPSLKSPVMFPTIGSSSFLKDVFVKGCVLNSLGFQERGERVGNILLFRGIRIIF